MTGSAGPDRLTLITFVILILLAGGNAVGIAIAVRELDPFFGAAMRFAAAGVIFAGMMAVVRCPVPRGRALLGALAYGAFGFFLGFGFTFWGFQKTPPGTGQLILALVPLLTLILAVAHRLERFRMRAALGASIAFCGVAVLMIDRVTADVPLLSMLAVMAGALFIAETGVLLKMTPGAEPLGSNAVGMLFGALLLAASSVAMGETWLVPTEPATFAAMGFLILAGSVVVFGLYVFLLGRWTASGVSHQFLLIPPVTMAYSTVLTGETLSLALLIGGLIILLGVYVGALSSAQPERRTP